MFKELQENSSLLENLFFHLFRRDYACIPSFHSLSPLPFLFDGLVVVIGDGSIAVKCFE